jgi:hypothetical protein
MTHLNPEQLRPLREATPPCVSIYLPIHHSPVASPQNRVRLKNLLREAETQLVARGEKHAERLLEPARELADDNAFWQRPGEGLALFLAPNTLREFRVSQPFAELAVVGDRFHFAPLLPLLTADDALYHVLALSQKHVRLFRGGRDGLEELDFGTLPRSVQQALHYDVSEHSLQFHSTPATPQTIGSRGRPTATGQAVPTGSRQGMFHGHGTVDEDAKEQVRRFFEVLSDGLEPFWSARPSTVPLVLGGVTWEQALFREISRHPRIVDGGVDGNPDGFSMEELRARSWQVAEPAVREDERRAADAFRDLAGTPRASSDLEEVVLAASDGRVDTLFYDSGVQRWGRFDAAARELEVHPSRQPGDEDLVDLAAAETVFRGGRVYPIRAGDGVAPLGPVAAVFRY